MTASPAYGASPVSARKRSTGVELSALDDAIVNAVRAEHPVSLRGVYYRVVSAGAVEKTEAAYKQVGRRLLALRRSHQVPYAWVTDGTRLRYKPDSWDNVEQMLADASASYRRALWNDQKADVIIMCEKDAITGVVYPVTREWDVELCITRGYSSETFTHAVSRTVFANHVSGKHTFLYQLGDHDPSGQDAWRSFEQRVRGFVPTARASFERLAVTPAQITGMGLPLRPTKGSDSRTATWDDGGSGGSVEVDAIPPTVLRGLVRRAIEQHIDVEQWRLSKVAEDSERAVLEALVRGGTS